MSSPTEGYELVDLVDFYFIHQIRIGDVTTSYRHALDNLAR
jgi:hypothetical protein